MSHVNVISDSSQIKIDYVIHDLIGRLSVEHADLIGKSESEILEQLIIDKFSELYPPMCKSVEKYPIID